MHYCIVQDKKLFRNNNPDFKVECPFCKCEKFREKDLLGMELPDDARDGRNYPCPFLGKANMLMTFSAKEIYFPSQQGVLSIKSAMGGEEIYEIDKKRFSIDENKFLVLPEGMSYASHISSKKEVESFCVFFGKPFIEDVFRALSLPLNKLLDEPAGTLNNPLPLKQKVYKDHQKLNFLFENLRAAVKIPGIINREIFEELMFSLLQAIIVNQVSLPEVETRLDKIAAPLRFEVLRRLLVAKEYIDDNLLSEVYLTDIAEKAYFSPFHFLRLFKDVFGMPPRQYIINKRLKMAKKLMDKTKKTITDIALETGFKSPNYFSRIFRKVTGITPREYRMHL